MGWVRVRPPPPRAAPPSAARPPPPQRPPRAAGPAERSARAWHSPPAQRGRRGAGWGHGAEQGRQGGSEEGSGRAAGGQLLWCGSGGRAGNAAATLPPLSSGVAGSDGGVRRTWVWAFCSATATCISSACFSLCSLLTRERSWRSSSCHRAEQGWGVGVGGRGRGVGWGGGQVDGEEACSWPAIIAFHERAGAPASERPAALPSPSRHGWWLAAWPPLPPHAGQPPADRPVPTSVAARSPPTHAPCGRAGPRRQPAAVCPLRCLQQAPQRPSHRPARARGGTPRASAAALPGSA